MNKRNAVKYIKQYGINIFAKAHMYERLHKHEKAHQLYKTYLENKYQKIIEKYADKESVLSPNAEPSGKKIWVLWWEGVEEMPEIVRYCCQSMKEHASGYEVVVLTKDNYNEYAMLPKHIIDHFKAGHIEIVHLADILRVFLLCQHGGIWLDATVFLSDDLPLEYMDKTFFSSNTGNRQSIFASKGRWSGYFMAVSHSHTVLFDYLQEIYTEYWQDHNIILCYFLLDYLLLMAYEHFEPIQKLIDAIPINNINVKKLSAKLNAPFDEAEWNEIKKDTVLHKLTWKRELYIQNNGYETFYGRLLVNNRKG